VVTVLGQLIEDQMFQFDKNWQVRNSDLVDFSVDEHAPGSTLDVSPTLDLTHQVLMHRSQMVLRRYNRLKIFHVCYQLGDTACSFVQRHVFDFLS
jgi:hypothetical protein